VLVIVVPVAVVDCATIRLNKLPLAVLAILFPVSIVDRAIKVLKATNPLKVSLAETTFVGPYPDEEHQALTFKIAVRKIAFIIIPVLEMEHTDSAEQIVLPLTLISVAASIVHCSEALFHSKVEVAFVPITVAG
jgi:hypothetical protein